jgi:plastocyanin
MDHARSRTTAARLLAATAALTLLLGACGGDDDDSSSDTTAAQGDSGGGGGTAEGGAAEGKLEVTSFDYSDVTAAAGGSLEVVNSSGGAHTFTADDGEFDEELPDGQTIQVAVPAEPGEYGFHCEIHPSMTATLTAQ